MRLTRIVWASLLFLSFVQPPVASREELWQVARLTNPLDGSLKCYTQPRVNAPVAARFGNGELIKTSAQQKTFLRVIDTTRRANLKKNCWVNKDSVNFLPRQIQGKIYPGTYRYRGTQPLPCRQAVGSKMPTTGLALLPNAQINVASVSLDDRAQTWFRLDCGSCYIPASERLLWAGQYEDPNTMCDYLRQNC